MISLYHSVVPKAILRSFRPSQRAISTFSIKCSAPGGSSASTGSGSTHHAIPTSMSAATSDMALGGSSLGNVMDAADNSDDDTHHAIPTSMSAATSDMALGDSSSGNLMDATDNSDDDTVVANSADE